MISWSKDELRKIAEADDLHISPFREGGLTYGTRLGFGPLRSMTPSTCAATMGRILVGSGRGAAEGGRIIAAGMTKEGHVRAGRRTDQQPHRRCLPGEVPWQPILNPMIGAPAPTPRQSRLMPREKQCKIINAPVSTRYRSLRLFLRNVLSSVAY